MVYQRLDDIYAMIERQHARFVAAASGLNDAQAQFRPAEDEWSIAEIAEHIGIANNSFLRVTHKLLKQAEAAGALPLAGLSLPHVLLDEEGRQNPQRFDAPGIVRPQGGQALTDSLAKIAQSIADFQAVRPRLEAVDCSQAKFPHPAVGELNAYQWMIVLGEHLDRHRGQIERIKTAPMFPI
jgi:hypothetical protein